MKEPRSHHKPNPFRGHPHKPTEVTLRAFCTRVVDGDTFDLLIESRPSHILTTERVRLLGADTPEMYGRNATPEGTEVKEWVEGLIQDRPVLITLDDKRDKYGRLLVSVFYFLDGDAGIMSLAKHLISEGKAVPA